MSNPMRSFKGRTYRQYVRAALDQGWTVELTRGGHVRWTSPTGQVVFSGLTPSGGKRSVENMLRMLRRAGLEV